MNPVAIGIDLGTTNSCAAILRNGQVEIIPNDHKSNTTPSWVTFASDGVYVGHNAKDNAHLYITNSIYEFKRLMGQKYENENISNTIRSVPYHIVNSDGIAKVEVDYQGTKKQYSPEQLSSYVLAYLKDTSERYLECPVDCVVVTVPAYFNDFQRQATKKAAIIAGFKTVNIINEPTAAAVAYNHHNSKEYRNNLLVYDFGGGTFDVSIVTVGRGRCVVKGTKGDSHLGGTDIDNNILNYIRNDYEKQNKCKLITDEVEIRRLKNKCEKTKIGLSGKRKCVNIELSMLSGREYSTILTISEFDSINKGIFEKTLEITETCIKESGLNKENIDEVLLVGGSSRNLQVQTMLKDYFGEEKIKYGINADEAVAYGAAIHAYNLLGNNLVVADVISMSLGIELLDKSFSKIILHNTPIPKKETKEYSTISNDVSINIYQGESNIAEENFKLGTFILHNINCCDILVTFEIDSEGILNVTSTSKTDNNITNNISIEVLSATLSTEQIREQTEEIRHHRENESKRIKFYEELHKAGTSSTGDNQQCSDITKLLSRMNVADKKEAEERKQHLERFNFI